MSSKAKSNSVKHSLEALKQKFPRYFIVDGDIPIKVDIDSRSEEVFAVNSIGNLCPPLKALCEGEEVNIEQFESASKILINS